MSRFSTSWRREFSGPHRHRGLAAVEFVISVPVLLLVMLATAELGRAFVQYDTLAYSVRDSARFVSENAIAGTTGVVNITPAVAQQARYLAVYGNSGGTGRAALPGFQTSQVGVLNAGNDNIEVNAAYAYRPMILSVLPAFGAGGGSIPLSFTMRISVTMRAIS
jgi:Flp pilus assembly protein TadG